MKDLIERLEESLGNFTYYMTNSEFSLYGKLVKKVKSGKKLSSSEKKKMMNAMYGASEASLESGSSRSETENDETAFLKSLGL